MKRVTIRKKKTNPDFYEVCENGKPLKMTGRNSFAYKKDAQSVADARRRLNKKK